MSDERQRKLAVRRVRSARARADRAQAELAAALHEARGAGATIVEIGAAAGLTHQRISQITKRGVGDA